MKAIVALLSLLTVAVAPARAQCKHCGCKEKCSPTCECKHDQKPEAQ